MLRQNKTGKDDRFVTKLQDQIERTFEVENGPARWVYYTKNFKKLILGSKSGHLSMLPIEGEMNKEEDDDSGDENNKKDLADIVIN